MHGDLGFLHRGAGLVGELGSRLEVGRRDHATDRHGHAADRDVESRRVERHAGRAGRLQESPRVRVAAEDRGLDQRRVGHGLRDPAGVALGRGTLDVDDHHVGHALAVGDQLGDERLADYVEGPYEVVPGGGTGFHDVAATRGAAGEQQHRVVRRRASVDRERVEPRRQHLAREPAQIVGGHRRVGRDEREHRGEVRRDHADALRASTHPERPRVGGRLLVHGVGRHDRAGERLASVGRQRADQRGHRRLHLPDVQRLADHARRAGQHLVGLGTEQRRRLGARGDRVVDPPRTRRRVGLAAVHEHRSDAAAREAVSPDLDRRGRHGVRGEQGRRSRARIAHEQAEVGKTARLEARRHPRGPEPERVRHAHGYTASVGRPSASSKPSARFRFWIA